MQQWTRYAYDFSCRIYMSKIKITFRKCFKRMLLFYCTVCALYPSLYATSLSISPLSITNENDADKDELETTSEGLCDFLREIFFLSRSTFNDYQIKALKKLLFRKSQAQVKTTVQYK
jgi:hypothetical protein